MLACIACLYFSDDTRIHQYYLERQKKLKWSIFHFPSTYDAAPYRFTSAFSKQLLFSAPTLKHYTTRLHFNTQRNYVMSKNSNSLEFTRKKKDGHFFFKIITGQGLSHFFQGRSFSKLYKSYCPKEIKAILLLL